MSVGYYTEMNRVRFSYVQSRYLPAFRSLVFQLQFYRCNSSTWWFNCPLMYRSTKNYKLVGGVIFIIRPDESDLFAITGNQNLIICPLTCVRFSSFLSIIRQYRCVPYVWRITLLYFITRLPSFFVQSEYIMYRAIL